MSYFIQQLLNALQLGSIYALIALGYTMVYGVLGLINFAHGDIFMAGAFFGFFTAYLLKLPLIPTLILSMLLASALGIMIERIAYRPLRKAPRMSLIITALGISLFLENFTRATLGGQPRSFPKLLEIQDFTFLGASVTNLQVVIILVSIFLMLVLRYIVQNTMIGKAMRAVSDNKEVLALMGISLDTVIMVTFGLGSALAATAGILVGLAYPVIDPYMGITVGWKAFIAAVLGGIGLINGALVGGFILGFIEIFAAALLPSTYRDGIAFTILIIVLLLKPTGLLGRPVIKKV
ncbi:MAG: branched-chain amino acid ABC transporter permease [Peptococcaceae bacterium]|nr:branched-chain amino acid ABC transporter permease [Peptococcaceae bacterium]